MCRQVILICGKLSAGGVGSVCALWVFHDHGNRHRGGKTPARRERIADRIAEGPSQRLEREIIGISEREQERIGQDLHDGICQCLAALSCSAASLKNDLEGRHHLAAEAKVAGDLAGFLRDAVVQTRNLARGLVPVQMDEAGLASALEELTASATRLLGIRCAYESAGTPVIRDNAIAMHLYRIGGKEAINNATKHGNAATVLVSLTEDGKATTLRIADDGRGVSKTAHGSDGMGLGLMYYRARLVGGELSIEEPATGGTVISCEIPSQDEEWRQQHAA